MTQEEETRMSSGDDNRGPIGRGTISEAAAANASLRVQLAQDELEDAQEKLRELRLRAAVIAAVQSALHTAIAFERADEVELYSELLNELEVTNEPI